MLKVSRAGSKVKVIGQGTKVKDVKFPVLDLLSGQGQSSRSWGQGHKVKVCGHKAMITVMQSRRCINTGAFS